MRQTGTRTMRLVHNFTLFFFFMRNDFIFCAFRILIDESSCWCLKLKSLIYKFKYCKNEFECNLKGFKKYGLIW